MTLLLISMPERAAVWSRVFAEAGEPILLDDSDPEAVTEIACWTPPDLARFPNLRAVICVGAGTDHMPPMPDRVVLSRTLAPGIEAMVRDWTVMAVLAMHRDLPLYLEQASRGEWAGRGAALARTRRVGIMGMGRIGRLVAQGLSALGFPVAGWSRSGDPVDGVEVFTDLGAFLARTDIVVCLLPLTDQTRGMMDDAFFAALPKGARLVHAGRGAQLDMDALRRALGVTLDFAMLDVTNPEPLPPGHWAWADPRVIVTPHIAAVTDAVEGAEHALAVLRALRTGAPVPGAVDRARGY